MYLIFKDITGSAFRMWTILFDLPWKWNLGSQSKQELENVFSLFAVKKALFFVISSIALRLLTSMNTD